MDKAVEELQQELKLLKNEIKETLTDVREVLLNTVENPFPQDMSPSKMTHTPSAPPVAPPPAAPPLPETETPPAPPSQPQGSQPSSAPRMEGPGMIPGNFGGGGAPGFTGGPGLPPSAQPQAQSGWGSGPVDSEWPSGGPGLPPSGRRVASERDAEADDEEADSFVDREDSRSKDGPGLPPRSRKRAAHSSDRPSDRDRSGRASGGPFAKRKEEAEERSRKRRAEAFEEPDDEFEDDDLLEHANDSNERQPSSSQPKPKVDLVAVASLSPWLSDAVQQLGRKRVKSLLEVYASMGGMAVEMKDVLLQIVAMDDTEGASRSVSVNDTMRFLVELDDLMWRGRQDWRRAALMSMIASGQRTFGD